MLRQAARWVTAAKQDQNPLIRLLHANYGVATVIALREIASDQEVVSLTGVDPREVGVEAVRVQDRAVQLLAPQCAHLLPKGPLARLAGES